MKSADHILSLKICDFAMGSGAFLVQTCRYLAECLLQAWQENPPQYLLPKDEEERRIFAMRRIAGSCLYGLDNNPMAVEMAKVSLWLAMVQKNRPFTFLDHSLR